VQTPAPAACLGLYRERPFRTREAPRRRHAGTRLPGPLTAPDRPGPGAPIRWTLARPRIREQTQCVTNPLAGVAVQPVNARRRRTQTWCIFSFVFGLLIPLGIYTTDLINNNSLTLDTLLGGGDQFLILAVLSVGAAGEVSAANVPPNRKGRQERLFAGALAAFFAHLCFYLVDPSHTLLIRWLSLASLVASFPICILCVREAAEY
jgi:hypothetical protein